MKSLKILIVFYIISLLVFYITAALIDAEFSIPKMTASHREIIFGIWGCVVVLGTMFHYMDKSSTNSNL